MTCQHRVGQQRLGNHKAFDVHRIGSSCIPAGRCHRRLKSQHVVRQHAHHLPRCSCRRLASPSAASRGSQAPAAVASPAMCAPSDVVRWRCPTCGRPLLPATTGGCGGGGGDRSAAAHGPAAGAGPAILRCVGGHAVSVAKQGHVNLLPAGRLQPKHAAAAGDDEAMVGPCVVVHVIMRVIEQHIGHIWWFIAVWCSCRPL